MKIFVCSEQSLPLPSNYPLTILPSVSHYLELLLIVLKGFHDHAYCLHRALKSAIHPIKAVHAAGYIHNQAKALGFLLWASQLKE